jgi:hypothetical protein
MSTVYQRIGSEVERHHMVDEDVFDIFEMNKDIIRYRFEPASSTQRPTLEQS